MKFRNLVLGLLMLAAGSAVAQAVPPPPRDYKPVLVSPSKQGAPEAPSAVTQQTMMRDALTMVCRTSIERSALGNHAFQRGKDVVPEAAAQYLNDMRAYQSFACPCLVTTLEKQFDFSDVSDAALARIKPAMGAAMQQSCSRDAYIAQLKPAGSAPTP